MDRRAYDFEDLLALAGDPKGFEGHGEVPFDPPARRGRERIYLDDISYLPTAEIDALAVIFADE